MCFTPYHNRGTAGGGSAASAGARLRRVACLLLALCALWTLTAALPVAAMVRLAASEGAASGTAAPLPVAEAAAACACLQCSSAAAHGGEGASCCCTPALGKETPPQTAACELRALCDEGAPDALLAGVSWCPPAVLPDPSRAVVLPSLFESVSLPPPPGDGFFAGGDQALPETPPRLS
jgi:hypothetical protein